MGRSARARVADSVSRWLDWTEANRTIWLATIAHGEDIADPEVRRVVADLVRRAVALLTTFHADIAEDSPRLRYALECWTGLNRAATRRWLRGDATREATHELLASTLEHVLRTFGAPPAPNRRPPPPLRSEPQSSKLRHTRRCQRLTRPSHHRPRLLDKSTPRPSRPLVSMPSESAPGPGRSCCLSSKAAVGPRPPGPGVLSRESGRQRRLPSRSFPELLSRVAQHDREQDAGDADDEREGHGDEVLELHAERKDSTTPSDCRVSRP